MFCIDKHEKEIERRAAEKHKAQSAERTAAELALLEQKALMDKEREKRTAQVLSERRKAINKAREERKQRKAEVNAEKEEEARKSQMVQELAQREVCRRHLLPFIQRFNDSYEAGWVHKDICARLEKFSADIAEGKSPRLMLFLPPRSGKSEIASRSFPAWHLGRYPEHEFISCSYSADLAMDFSRKVREVIRLPEYGKIFRDTKMDRDSQRIDKWATTANGGYTAAGIGGPITGRGANCVKSDEEVILTENGLKSIDQLLKNCEEVQYVLTYDGKNIVRRRINAIITRESDHYYEVETQHGVLKVTGEHPLCVGWEGGRPIFRRADDLRRGETLFTVDGAIAEGQSPMVEVPNVRNVVNERNLEISSVEGCLRESASHMLEFVLGSVSQSWEAGKDGLRKLWERILREQNVCREKGSERANNPVLQCEVLRGASVEEVCWGESSPLQFSRIGMSGMWDIFRETKGEGREARESLLQSGVLCIRTPWWAYEPAADFPWGAILPSRVQDTSERNASSGMCSLWRRSDRPSSQGRGQREQCAGEFSTDVSFVPCETPSGYSASVIKRITRIEGAVRVGDIEVEGSHSFLTSTGNLLLNCFIIDDPVKNSDDANSESIRRSVKEWYTSTAYTRLAPGGGMLVIMTRWHDDDLAGWLLHQMEKDEGDTWEVIKYPAIATKDERYRKKGEALHSERYPIEALERIKKTVGSRVWSALYQQNPVADEGEFFNRGMFKVYSSKDMPSYESLTYYTAWDLAIGQKETNDESFGITVGIDRNRKLWVVDVRHGRWGSEALVDQILDCYTVWKSSITGIERGQIEMAIGPYLEQRIRERGLGTMFIQKLLPGRRDKQARARPIQALMERGDVMFRDGCDDTVYLINQMLRFPSGVHDDGVDAIAWVGQLIQDMTVSREAPVETRGKKRQSMHSRLRKELYGGGGGGGHMTA